MGVIFSFRVQINVVIDDICNTALIEIVTKDWTKTNSLSSNVFYYGGSHQQRFSIRFCEFLLIPNSQH